LKDKFYIQKVIEGDTESFKYLIERYQEKAFSVAFSILHNQIQCEDAVQEAFIKAYRKLATFRGDAAFSTWLMRIVVNECIKVLRHKKNEIEGQKHIDTFNEKTTEDSLFLLKNIEQRKYIDLTLKQMPQREAMVLQLYYLNELSLKEMEELMELKADHIKVLVHRARRRFYAILEDELKHELASLI